jgi:hypothetical protein
VYVSWSSSSTYGGDSGNRIFVLYWRCLLIRVSVIRGSTVLGTSLIHRQHVWSYLILEGPIIVLGFSTVVCSSYLARTRIYP